MLTSKTQQPEFTKDSMFETMRVAINVLLEWIANHVLGVSPIIAIGTTSVNDIKISAAVDYIRDGIRRAQKAAAELDVPAAASLPNDGTARSVVVLVTIDSSDAYAGVVGLIATGGDTAQVPDLPAGSVLLGHVRIAAAAGTAYVANTTALNAAGITSTFTSLVVPVDMFDKTVRMGNQ